MTNEHVMKTPIVDNEEIMVGYIGVWEMLCVGGTIDVSNNVVYVINIRGIIYKEDVSLI